MFLVVAEFLFKIGFSIYFYFFIILTIASNKNNVQLMLRVQFVL